MGMIFTRDSLIQTDRGRALDAFASNNQVFTRANFTKTCTLGSADSSTITMIITRESGTKA